MVFQFLGWEWRQAWAAVGVTSACGVAAAQQPKVDYAADWQMEPAEGKQIGKIFHSAGLERRELDEGGEKIILIARPDKKLMWNLIPSEKMYMEMASGQDKMYRGELWLHVARAQSGAGDDQAAAEWQARGARWVRDSAESQVPESFRDSFLQRHPVNVALLGHGPRSLFVG